MSIKRDAFFLTVGTGIGVAVPRAIPKTPQYKTVKYAVEIMKAYFRLQKVLQREYHRIDDAIEEELTMLNLMNPHTSYTDRLHVSFEVTDDGHDRSVRLDVKADPPGGSDA